MPQTTQATQRDTTPATVGHRVEPVLNPVVMTHPAEQEAAQADFAGGQNATQPAAEQGDAPIPGEEAWLMDAMKYNRRQPIKHSQWVAIQRHLGIHDDGKPGKGTARALFRWQTSNQLDPDGMLGSGSLSALESAIASGGQEQGQTQTQTQEPQTEAEPDPDPEPDPQAGGEQGDKRDASIEKDGTQFMKVVDQVTSVMEGGSTEGEYHLVQTKDHAGVSYGKHQATLHSGTLGGLLKTYLELAKADSPNRAVIARYMPRVRKRDMSLRGESAFHAALKAAAGEAEMQSAQDTFFTSHYGKPAWDAAKKNNVKSPLGYAMLYDTNIQGGLTTLINRTRKRLGGGIGDTVKGKVITEQKFLDTFNDLRDARLKAIAANKRKKGDKRSANMVNNSRYRVRAFRELIKDNNLNVAGKDGKLRIKGPGGDRYEIDAFDSKAIQGGNTERFASIPAIGTATVTANNLSVRGSASLDGDKLDSLKTGATVEVIGRSGEWLRIKAGGQLGYIHGGYATYKAKS